MKLCALTLVSNTVRYFYGQGFMQLRTASLQEAGLATAATEAFSVDNIVLEFIASQTLACYADLADFDGASAFSTSLAVLGEQAPNAKLASIFTTDRVPDLKVIKAMAHFDNADLGACHATLQDIEWPAGSQHWHLQSAGKRSTCHLLTAMSTALATRGSANHAVAKTELEHGTAVLRHAINSAHSEGLTVLTRSLLIDLHGAAPLSPDMS